MERITTAEIKELALRYIDESECVNIPEAGDVFALLVRKNLPFSKKSEKWLLAGYGIISDYIINTAEKPYGKWITMNYLALDSFPPRESEIRLQPPHIARGYFQGFDRLTETKIVKLDTNNNDDGHNGEAKILQFPGT